MPGARCTRSLVCKVLVAHECRRHRYSGSPGIPARNGFNGFLRALPGDRACLPPSPADMACQSPVGPTCLRKLDASVGASGPHDFTVRSKRRSSARRLIAHGSVRPAPPSRRTPDAARVHRIPPRVRDDRETPLSRDGTAGDILLIWVRRERKYFCKQDWTARINRVFSYAAR